MRTIKTTKPTLNHDNIPQKMIVSLSRLRLSLYTYYAV